MTKANIKNINREWYDMVQDIQPGSLVFIDLVSGMLIDASQTIDPVSKADNSKFNIKSFIGFYDNIDYWAQEKYGNYPMAMVLGHDVTGAFCLVLLGTKKYWTFVKFVKLASAQ